MANEVGGEPTTRQTVRGPGLTPVETTKVLKVTMNDGGHEAIINEGDFDEELHTKVDGPKAKGERIRLRPEVLEENLDESDLKESGPPKTKAEKDRLEQAGKAALAKGKSAGDAVNQKKDQVGLEAVESATKGYAATSGANNPANAGPTASSIAAPPPAGPAKLPSQEPGNPNNPATKKDGDEEDGKAAAKDGKKDAAKK